LAAAVPKAPEPSAVDPKPGVVAASPNPPAPNPLVAPVPKLFVGGAVPKPVPVLTNPAPAPVAPKAPEVKREPLEEAKPPKIGPPKLPGANPLVVDELPNPDGAALAPKPRDA